MIGRVGTRTAVETRSRQEYAQQSSASAHSIPQPAPIPELSHQDQMEQNVTAKFPLQRLCFCNYGPEVCEFENTCIKHRQAACFHAVHQEFNAELGEPELHHLFGCAPLESGSDASHLTCNAWRPVHSAPRSIACCYEGNFCNWDLAVPDFPALEQIDAHSPPNAIFNSSGPLSALLFLLAGSLIGLCLFLAVAAPLAFLCRRGKAKELMDRLHKGSEEGQDVDVEEQGSLLLGGADDGKPDKCSGSDDSGSGSGGIALVQRSIALDLQMQEVFARGRYGELRKALYRGSLVAVKIFYPTEEESWRNERSIYQSQMLNHENILQYVAADILSSVETLTQMMLITDFHPLGSLYDYLRSDSLLSMDEALQLMLSTVSGLEHLHNGMRGTEGKRKPEIAHRDIKSKNVLVKRTGVCCIADFGLAVRFEEGAILPKKVNVQVGTKRYMAPELLSSSLNVANFDEFKCADIYSFALMLWEIANRVQIPDSDPPPPSASGSPLSSTATVPPPPTSQCRAGNRHQRIMSRSSSGIVSDRTFSNSLSNGNGHAHQFGMAKLPHQILADGESLLDGSTGGKRRSGSGQSAQEHKEHALPFQGVVDTDPSFEQMRKVVCEQKLRPRIDPGWRANGTVAALCDLMSECWSEQPRSRHTALKVKKELAMLLHHQESTSNGDSKSQ